MKMHKHRTSKGPIHTHGSADGGHDGAAHSSHHAANKEHGTSFHAPDEDEYEGPSECAGKDVSMGRAGKKESYKGQRGNERNEDDYTPKSARD
jgi:hypothetical protein